MIILDEYLPIENAGQEAYKAFYTWTAEDASKAQEIWSSTAHHPCDRGPAFQWDAAIKLKDLADNYISTGDKARILEALFICNMNQMSVPRWCCFAFIDAYREVWFKAKTSWDDVFGKPHKKGTHSNDIRKTRNDALKVYYRIQELNKNVGLPVDENMFDRVGRELGVGAKTKTATLYYGAKGWIDEINHMKKHNLTKYNQKDSQEMK
ncbi:MAG: hypothetical protein KJ630_24655 [Proteobacteria bacterium]|nr:hypothetical protein [Pseudomonadota bacterium]